jgi:acetyl esterase/lipase
MPLDRHAKRILQMLAAGSNGAQGPFELEAVRKSMLELAQALDPRDLAPVASVDHGVPGADGVLLLRQYLPAAHPAAGPGLLYLHGGIGVFGSVVTHDALCRMLCADGGLVVLSLEYRLAPEHPFPAGLEDAVCAADWALRQAARLALDPRRLAIGGDSAGATLAAVVCQLARDRGAPAPAAQLLLCPVTDPSGTLASRSEFGDGYFMSRALLDWGLDQVYPPGVDRHDPRVAPLRAADLSRLPPAIVHTAEFDPFRDEGAAYAQALGAAGVAARYVCHAGLIHHYYGMAGGIPAARQAVRQSAQELRELLDGLDHADAPA